MQFRAILSNWRAGLPHFAHQTDPRGSRKAPEFPGTHPVADLRLPERHGHALWGCRLFLLTRKLPIGGWDPISKSYYWHRFFSHQPEVFELLEVMKFWLNLGVRMRWRFWWSAKGLAAENLPETHAIIREIRKRLDAVYPGTMLLSASMRHFIFR